MNLGFDCEVVGTKEIVINLTNQCNNNCLNCPNDDSFKATCISKDSIIEYIKKSINKDTQRVGFIGGEPTVFKQLFEIMDFVLKINADITLQINSNGRMFVYEDFANHFVKYKNLDLHISLYASNAKLHDEITQVRGSFEQTVQGIKNLLSLGMPVKVRNIVSKKNYKDLPNYSHYLIDNFTGFAAQPDKIIFVGMDTIGNAYANKDILPISHKSIAPYIEKGIDILTGNLDIEVHLIPKGFFKKEYYGYITLSGCVGGNFVDAVGCSECVFKRDCCRLLKSYTDIYGDAEHLPILKR